MFEFFVKETIWLYDILLMYNWIFSIFYFLSFICSIFIFIYHELKYRDLTFYLDNVEHLYDFSWTRYSLNKLLFSVCVPLSFFVIFLSLFQRFNSVKFLVRFG